MTIYIDAGVVRIQEYINRTSGSDEAVLKKRRGASRMVAAATNAAALAKLCKGLALNDETYQTEGVTHLKYPIANGEDSDERPSCGSGDDSAQPNVHAVVRSLLQHMRDQLPAAHIEISWAEANRYVNALATLGPLRAGGSPKDENSGRVVSLPPTRDESASATCSSCGISPAESDGTDEMGGTCTDCTLREKFGGESSGASPQDEVISQLKVTGCESLRSPSDMRELSRLPEGDNEPHKLNHLATVYADGNNVGALFQTLKENLAGAKDLSKALDDATKSSGREALEQLLETHATSGQGACVLPGQVTTLAADDVLITVPAAWGWQFVLTLVGTFNSTMNESMCKLTSQHKSLPKKTTPSLTAGIVFHHEKSPIETAIREAFDVMRLAKDETRGQESAIGWLDVTAERTPRARPFKWFTTNCDGLVATAGMPRSQISKLDAAIKVGLRKRHDGSDNGDQVTPEQVLAFLRAEMERVASAAEIERLLPAKASDLERLKQLDDALSLVRWFPSNADHVCGEASPCTH